MSADHPAVVTGSAETPSPVTVTRCTGADLPALMPALARLRVQVFRAWPYLYDGNEAYEAEYLHPIVRSPQSAVIVARQGERIVGASTCLPLADESAAIQAPFHARGWDIRDFFYFGESVLLPELRGQGVGVAFFNEREAHARSASACKVACFCSVVRPDDHPARPPGFVPLDAFWTRRGFTPRPDVTCELAWTDIGDDHETTKQLRFWMKPLHGQQLP